MNFKEILELEKAKVMAWDTHNHNLLVELNRCLADNKLKGLMTDHEVLEAVANIVNRRKISWGTTDRTTGLTYKR
jgi:glycine/serine hydroxymethyltransferase